MEHTHPTVHSTSPSLTHPNPATAATRGPVLVIGVGLIGGSIGLALTREGLPVYLRDASPTAVALATSLGAGKADPGKLPLSEAASLAPMPPPNLVVVAAPPDVTAPLVIAALHEFPQACVLDVASVKSPIIAEVLREDLQAAQRYCSVHPMAGKEANGVAAASAELFVGKPWVVVAHSSTRAETVVAARNLGTDLGAFLVSMEVEEHDRAVALVSHVPQLVSSLLAGLLAQAPLSALELAGGGLRDTTRIAASDPRLWNVILAGNAQAVREVLQDFRAQLDRLLSGLDLDRECWFNPAVGAINQVMTAGNEGVARIPGKHGDAASKYGTVSVLIPDEPGFLGRLFAEIGDAGINIEDFRLEHSLGQAQGLATIYVVPASVEPLCEHLQRRGWSVANL